MGGGGRRNAMEANVIGYLEIPVAPMVYLLSIITYFVAAVFFLRLFPKLADCGDDRTSGAAYTARETSEADVSKTREMAQ